MREIMNTDTTLWAFAETRERWTARMTEAEPNIEAFKRDLEVLRVRDERRMKHAWSISEKLAQATLLEQFPDLRNMNEPQRRRLSLLWLDARKHDQLDEQGRAFELRWWERDEHGDPVPMIMVLHDLRNWMVLPDGELLRWHP